MPGPIVQSRTVDQIFDSRGASQKLASSPRTLEGWRAQGRGPRWIHLGRAVRYRESDLAAWISSRPAQGGGQ
jgi:predicted DNA-binding transcriptional regulator AlpA